MEDFHRGVDGTGKSENDDFDPAEFARGVWDSVYSAFAKGSTPAESKDGADKSDSSRAAKPAAETEKVNQWQFDGKPGERSERITIKSEINVEPRDFRLRNPSVTGKDEELVGKGDFKARHATTGEVDGGWKLEGVNKDGTLRLSKDYQMLVQSRKDHDGLVEAIPGVSKEHVQALEKKLAQLPDNVLKALKDAGYKVIATRFNSDAIPELKDLTPRGWDKRSTFDTSDGTHDNVRRAILAPTSFRDQYGREQDTDRPEVLVHQIGHALDHAKGKLSNDPEFQQAFQKDMQALARKGSDMTEREKLIYNYFNQQRGPTKGEFPGSEEGFASFFGLILTGPENPEDREPFEANFKNTIDVVRSQIRRL